LYTTFKRTSWQNHYILSPSNFTSKNPWLKYF
jgi:hypothetical protein